MTWPTVYLSGPITGCTYEGCTDWREYATKVLTPVGIQAVSPMRAKDYLKQLADPISGHGREYSHMGVFSTPSAVVTRDRFDTQRADIVLMNLLGADRVSIGTMVELGWADAARVPVVGIIEPSPDGKDRHSIFYEGNIHDHMFVNQLIGFRVATLDEGLHVVRATLGR